MERTSKYFTFGKNQKITIQNDTGHLISHQENIHHIIYSLKVRWSNYIYNYILYNNTARRLYNFFIEKLI